MLGLLLLPAGALAHGPVDPSGSSYRATVTHTPAGLRAIVVDGDQRLWLAVAPHHTAIVLDYRGAPYLRFSAAGVAVNRNSAMYYLNQVPVQAVPGDLTPATPPVWIAAASGHGDSWHDGRLHALATTALSPGQRVVGTWRIPLRLDGAPAAVTGRLEYAPPPPLVWFWPVVVAVACALAGLRLRRRELDRRLSRGLSAGALAAVAVAGAGEQLHGRPGVSVSQYGLLVVVIAFVAWGAVRVLRGREGWFGTFVIALAALWEGGSLIGVLTHGFVLIALPAAVARIAVAACLACGAALLPVVFRIAERPVRVRGPQDAPGSPPVASEPRDRAATDAAWEDAWERAE